jgi:hypothetical protein
MAAVGESVVERTCQWQTTGKTCAKYHEREALLHVSGEYPSHERSGLTHGAFGLRKLLLAQTHSRWVGHVKRKRGTAARSVLAWQANREGGCSSSQIKKGTNSAYRGHCLAANGHSMAFG